MPSKKIILVLGLLIYSTKGNTQSIYKELNQQEQEYKKVHFGIHFGFVQSHYNILHSPSFLLFDSINVVESFNSTGINLAGLVNVRLNNYFDFRTYPLNLIFTEKSLLYKLKYPDIFKGEDSVTIKKVSGVALALPLEIKFNSDRINNFRAYMLAGMRFEYDLASNTGKKNNNDLVVLKKIDYAIEGAIGFHFYLPMVTLTPEIKIAYGVRNLLSKEVNNKYANTIDDIRSRSITFTLTVE